MSISSRDRKLLWGRAKNLCCFPKCPTPLIEDRPDATTGDINQTVVGEEAHIRSGRKDGPRYAPDYPADKVDTYANIILLCPTHHTIVDAHGGASYTASELERMRAVHEQEQRWEEADGAARAFMSWQYERDNKVLFEQAELHGPTVESMFVDVPFGCGPSDAPYELLRRISLEHPGDVTPGLSEDAAVTGAAQALLHPEWKGSGLIVGGPGQGKSTLLQFLCQFHRSRLLGKQAYSGEGQKLSPLTERARVTFRVDLRNYAFWATQRQSNGQKKGSKKKAGADSHWPILEEYLAHEVSGRTGRDFSVQDLELVTARLPTLIALDGLDEVSDVKLRDRVAEGIVDLYARLEADTRDIIILVASRPGGTASSLWSTPGFPRLNLAKLSYGLQVQYLQKWSAAAELPPEVASKLQRTFADNESKPHIREIASYPMQLAILLHLLQRRQMLPQKRTDLYDEYMKTFLDREQGSDKEPLLARERTAIEDAHAYVGWRIQTETEEGRSSGAIRRQDLKRVFQDQLEDRNDGVKLAKKMFAAMSFRVLCLTEREPGWFEFDVASLREYFAATYLFDEAEREFRDDCLAELLRRPQWSNVCRFYVGKFSRTEVRGILEVLRSLDEQPGRAHHPGARAVAVQFLNDRVYEGQKARPIQEVVDFVLEGSGVFFAEDGMLEPSGVAMTLSSGAGRAQVVAHCKTRLEVESDRQTRQALARCLRRHAEAGDEVTNWWWSLYDPALAWLDTAADLHLLGSLAPTQEDQLAVLVTQMVAEERQWITVRLLQGGYNGSNDNILGVVLREINDGVAAVVGAADRASSVGRLLATARACWAAGESVKVSGRRLRARRAGYGKVLAAMVDVDETLAPRPSTTDAQGWANRFVAIRAALGTGWVIHHAISTCPPEVDLRPIAKILSQTDAEIGAAVELEADARVSRDSATWWRERLSAGASPQDVQLAVLSALTTMTTNTLVEVSPELGAAIDVLSPRQIEAIRWTVQAVHTNGATRRLMLDESLRRNHGTFSPRLLWVCRPLVPSDSRDRLDTRICAVVPELLGELTPGEASALAAIGGGKKVHTVTTFQGHREGLSNSRWTLKFKTRDLTVNQADAILQDPGQWPAALVRRAASFWSSVPPVPEPMSHAADTQRWFDGA